MLDSQITVGDKKYTAKILFDEATIQKRIAELADSINKTYSNQEPLVILIVLHGAILFAADLIKRLTLPTFVETVTLKSYSGMNSTGSVTILTSLPHTLNNSHVLVVEDILDTGRSLHALQTELGKIPMKSLRVATLLDKPEARKFPVTPDFLGFYIHDNFVIGYGLDLDGKYRNLPYIAELV